MSFKSTEEDCKIYDDTEIFKGYPENFTKNFMLAGEGHVSAFNNLIDNFGYFTIGYDCKQTGNTKKEYHSIQWASEAYHTIFNNYETAENLSHLRSEMFDKIKKKCRDNKIKNILLNDANTQNYFTENEYKEIKNIKLNI